MSAILTAELSMSPGRHKDMIEVIEQSVQSVYIYIYTYTRVRQDEQTWQSDLC